MTDNRDKEIVRLAVELATDVAGEAKVRHDDKVAKAKRLLALASPPEPEKPKRFPGIDAEPKLWQPLREGCQRYQIYATGKWSVYGPLCNTPTAAVAAWNEMIDRITGTDNNVIAMARDTIKCDDNCPACKKMWQEWLAERTGGGE